MKARSAAIIIDPAAHAVLLIHRWKEGREYYVLPGGKIEDGETPRQACEREAREETGLLVIVEHEVASLVNLDRLEHYFLVEAYSGVLELGFPEKGWQSRENIYQLEWVPADRLPGLNLLPTAIRPVVARCLER